MQPPLILTIDDEAAIRSSFCHFLGDLDYRVEQAADGAIGIDAIQKLQPDLVLVDLRMPGVDGLDVLRWVNQHQPLTPVIVVSGTGLIADVIEALKLGAWDYLLKPVADLEMLRLAIERALETAALRQQESSYQKRLEREVAKRTQELRSHELMLEKTACEERLLRALASQAMEHIDSAPFICEAVKMLQQQMPGLSLLSQAQLWNCSHGCWQQQQLLRQAELAIGELTTEQLQAVADGSELYQCLSEQNGYRLLIPLRSQHRDLGILVLFGTGDRCQLEYASFLGRLAEVLSLAMLHQASERELHYQANHDSLTSLPNRQSLHLLLQQQLSSALRRHERGAVLFLDLDNFKTLNDSLGHSLGDLLLQQLGLRVREALRDEDILARLGGDEFVVVLPCRDRDRHRTEQVAAHVCSKIQQVISRPFQLGSHEYVVGCSIGVALFPDAGDTTEDLLKHADSAMYLAKAAGRNSFRFYSPQLQRQADRRLYLEHKLRRALEQDELEPYFQPQFDRQQQVVGAEVLLRWHNDEDGWISPAEFIPVAEESGLIIPISNWLLEGICRRMGQWQQQGLLDRLTSLSINVSPNQFYQPGFGSKVLEALQRNDVEAGKLTLEITEGVVLRSMDESVEIIGELGAKGVRFSLDDFGTGYSSLAYLKKLPVDELKIDKSFILEIDRNPDDVKIVDAILSLASHFGLEVVAEGVENIEAIEMLRQRDCPLYQGFYYSRPLPEQAFIEFLNQA